MNITDTVVSELKCGLITSYNEFKGYGFLRESHTDKLTNWFFHITNCLVEPKIGLYVQFRITVDPVKGKPKAIEVDAVQPTVADLLAGRSVETEPKEQI